MNDIIKECEGVLKMIKLGDTVRDKITGFEGIAIKRQEQLGFSQTLVAVQRTILSEDGFPFEEMWFSEERLEVIKNAE